PGGVALSGSCAGPADTLVSAVDNARRDVVTHITIKGERVAAIVSESTLAMAQLLAVLLTDEMADRDPGPPAPYRWHRHRWQAPLRQPGERPDAGGGQVRP